MNFLRDLIENPEGRKRLKGISHVVLALIVAIDFFVPREHAYFLWETLPGFGALCGFISCVLIIVVSKALGKYWLVRNEDYYE